MQEVSTCLSFSIWCKQFRPACALCRRMWEYDRKVLFKVAFELLLHSKRTNGPLMGVMFWNAAQIDIPDSDG